MGLIRVVKALDYKTYGRRIESHSSSLILRIEIQIENANHFDHDIDRFDTFDISNISMHRPNLSNNHI